MGHVDVATRQAAQGCGVIIIKAAVIVNTKFSVEWKSTKLNKIHGAEVGQWFALLHHIDINEMIGELVGTL